MGRRYPSSSRAELAGALLASGRFIGANIANYDPTLDPKALYAAPLAFAVADAFQQRS